MTTRLRIRELFRDITGTSEYQVSDTRADQYINDYYTVDMAEDLQLWSLKTEYVFDTVPYQAEYDLTSMPNSGGNVLNSYFQFLNPLYFSGYTAMFYEDIAVFRHSFPEIQTFGQKSTADGIVNDFSFSLYSGTVLPNRVIVQTQDTNGIAQVLKDDGQGVLSGDGTGTVNYLTGAVSNVIFNNLPASGQTVDAQWVELYPSRPLGLLYYGTSFIIRPIPDRVYEVRISAYQYLTDLLQDSASPLLNSWWELLAYGAAIKYFQGRRDMLSVQEYYPVLKKFEERARNRSVRQQQQRKRSTIYDRVNASNSQNIYFPNNGVI